MERPVAIHVDSKYLEGTLAVPSHATSIILFAHGSGSGRLSPRNNYVAARLRTAHMGTLLLDLLTPYEDQDARKRFDIGLLTQRLEAALDWLHTLSRTKALPVGLFGASTGAAAALQLAAMRKPDIAAVVSRGGRPDLAGAFALQKVEAPTLLIAGGQDHAVLELNQAAYAALSCEKKLEIVPGATHLFEEPGKLEAVANLAARWFAEHLVTQEMPS